MRITPVRSTRQQPLEVPGFDTSTQQWLTGCTDTSRAGIRDQMSSTFDQCRSHRPEIEGNLSDG
jgi:hypothetical protein